MAKKKSQEQLNLEREVKKEQQRIKRRVRDLKRKGYTVPQNIVPEMPKNVTEKTLYRFQQFTPTKIREKSVYTNPTGVTVSGTQHFKESLSERSKKAAQTRKQYYKREPTKIVTQQRANRIDVTIDRIEEQLDAWTPNHYWSEELTAYKERDKNRISGILQGSIEQLGREQVALNAMAKSIELNAAFDKALYESGNKYVEDSRNNEINVAINRIATILFGGSLTPQQSEYLTSLGEGLESHELIT